MSEARFGLGGMPGWLEPMVRFCSRCGGRLAFGPVAGEERDRLACPSCGFVFYVNPRLVVTTLPITDRGQLILIRRGIEPGRGQWAQPGGFLEIDETVRDAAIRETLEETGLRVEPGAIVGLYSRVQAAVVVVAFEARIVGGTPEVTRESQETRPFAPDAIPWSEIAFETSVLALRDWVARVRPDLPLPDPFDDPQAVWRLTPSLAPDPGPESLQTPGVSQRIMRLTYKRIMSKLFLMNSLAESLHLDYWLTPDAEEQLRTWAAAMATEPPLHPIRWHMYLQHYLRSATVTASTQIEGNPLSLPQVDALLQGEAVDAPLRARREVINYNAALSTATSLALTPSFEWSQAVLRMLNHEILRGDPDDRQGRYREEPVTAAGFYYPPDHRLVDGLMASLVEWLGQAQDPPLVRVALLHLNLVAIHPWVNGNGRTARVASSLELMRHGVTAPELVSVEPYLREHQDEYFDRLRTTLGPSYAPDRHPATEWVNYYVGVSVGRLAFETRMEDAWPNDLGCLHDAMQNAGLPLAWVPVLLMAAIAPLRTRIVADQMDRSMPTARAMLARMEREGWLIHRGRTRGASYEPGPRLCALTLRTPELVQDYVRGHTLGLVP